MPTTPTHCPNGHAVTEQGHTHCPECGVALGLNEGAHARTASNGMRFWAGLLLVASIFSCVLAAVYVTSAMATRGLDTSATPRPTVAIPAHGATPTRPASPAAHTPSPTRTPTLARATRWPTPDLATCTVDAGYLRDVTVPDGMAMLPGTRFDKTWLLQNTGTCAWTQALELRCVSGEQLGVQASVPLPSAAAGAQVEVTVPMRAPSRPGRYRSD